MQGDEELRKCVEGGQSSVVMNKLNDFTQTASSSPLIHIPVPSLFRVLHYTHSYRRNVRVKFREISPKVNSKQLHPELSSHVLSLKESFLRHINVDFS